MRKRRNPGVLDHAQTDARSSVAIQDLSEGAFLDAVETDSSDDSRALTADGQASASENATLQQFDNLSPEGGNFPLQ
jgi:hypothetical protein